MKCRNCAVRDADTTIMGPDGRPHVSLCAKCADQLWLDGIWETIKSHPGQITLSSRRTLLFVGQDTTRKES